MVTQPTKRPTMHCTYAYINAKKAPAEFYIFFFSNCVNGLVVSSFVAKINMCNYKSYILTYYLLNLFTTTCQKCHSYVTYITLCRRPEWCLQVVLFDFGYSWLCRHPCIEKRRQVGDY